jgi:DNA-binding response OmpR family regulator
MCIGNGAAFLDNLAWCSIRALTLISGLCCKSAFVTPRILVVEDEPMLRRLLARALTEAGYVVDEASDGLAGWELARSIPQLDLAITDSRLPRLSGTELVKRLRELNPKLPIINLSGSHGEKTSAYRQFPSDVPTLFKPFELRELVRVVGELLQRTVHDSNGSSE